MYIKFLKIHNKNLPRPMKNNQIEEHTETKNEFNFQACENLETNNHHQFIPKSSSCPTIIINSNFLNLIKLNCNPLNFPNLQLGPFMSKSLGLNQSFKFCFSTTRNHYLQLLLQNLFSNFLQHSTYWVSKPYRPEISGNRTHWL